MRSTLYLQLSHYNQLKHWMGNFTFFKFGVLICKMKWLNQVSLSYFKLFHFMIQLYQQMLCRTQYSGTRILNAIRVNQTLKCCQQTIQHSSEVQRLRQSGHLTHPCPQAQQKSPLFPSLIGFPASLLNYWFFQIYLKTNTVSLD